MMSILIAFKILSSLLSLLTGSFTPTEILFESLESKTESNRPVFNKIQLSSTAQQDIWTMKQSHHGLTGQQWDDIKIIVNKKHRPFFASYHQLQNGK